MPSSAEHQFHSSRPVPWGRILDAPLSADRARAHVLGDTDGAMVIFEGVVRNHDGGESVAGLDYSAHPDAEKALQQIVSDIAREFEVAVFAEHRVGSLAVGDAALVAACASAHRKASFEACAELVERIKIGVPIWKNQHFTSGRSGWVGLDDAR